MCWWHTREEKNIKKCQVWQKENKKCQQKGNKQNNSHIIIISHNRIFLKAKLQKKNHSKSIFISHTCVIKINILSSHVVPIIYLRWCRHYDFTSFLLLLLVRTYVWEDNYRKKSIKNLHDSHIHSCNDNDDHWARA